MTALLLLLIVVLTVAICALAVIWFLPKSKAREQKSQHSRNAQDTRRGAAGHHVWDGGIRTSRNRR